MVHSTRNSDELFQRHAREYAEFFGSLSRGAVARPVFLNVAVELVISELKAEFPDNPDTLRSALINQIRAIDSASKPRPASEER